MDTLIQLATPYAFQIVLGLYISGAFWMWYSLNEMLWEPNQIKLGLASLIWPLVIVFGCIGLIVSVIYDLIRR